MQQLTNASTFRNGCEKSHEILWNYFKGPQSTEVKVEILKPIPSEQPQYVTEQIINVNDDNCDGFEFLNMENVKELQIALDGSSNKSNKEQFCDIQNTEIIIETENDEHIVKDDSTLESDHINDSDSEDHESIEINQGQCNICGKSYKREVI